jgi:septum site-determining protein MinD
MRVTKYINVVSGKGGTGKTLLCTILAELLGNQNVNVLILDMDIFVRGLTALLYFQKGESLKLTSGHELSISDIFYPEKPFEGKLAIHKYRSFDICPAVERINQIFDSEREMISDYKHNNMSFHRIMDLIPQDQYDYVFFDCRAGYDSLVSAIHERSDMTICVQEEDDISEVTANNLIRQLERDSSRKTIFKIVNKARNIKTYDDLERKKSQGLSFLGYIPFDMDVMNSFGEKSFWDDISRSLYKSAAAETWNRLAAKGELKHTLHYKRYSPLINDTFERPFGFLSSPDRVFALMGLMLGLMGLLYTVLGKDLIYIINMRPDQLISFIITFVGFAMFLFSFLRRRKSGGK